MINATSFKDDRLALHIVKGKEAIAKLEQAGAPVPYTWQDALAELEAEMAHRRNVKEIVSLMEADGYAIVWSDTLGETMAFAKDDLAAAQVPGGIVTYTRDELEQIVGKGHDPDMLKLIHEGKTHGGKVTGQKETRP